LWETATLLFICGAFSCKKAQFLTNVRGKPRPGETASDVRYASSRRRLLTQTGAYRWRIQPLHPAS